MFGDFWITLAMVVSIVSMIGCILYGLLNWNKE